MFSNPLIKKNLDVQNNIASEPSAHTCTTICVCSVIIHNEKYLVVQCPAIAVS